MYPRTPSTQGVARPDQAISFDDLPAIVSLSDVCKATRIDKKTVLKAIHAGSLPAWFPGGNPQLGFRIHKGDVEAWYFSDPSRAFTKGTGDTRVKTP